MKPHRPIILLFLSASLLPLAAQIPAPAPAPTAKQLAASVIAQQHTRGLTANGRMVITAPATERRTLQFLIHGRQDHEGSQMLYLALYPQADKGRAVVIRKGSDNDISGFIREPSGKIQNLKPERMKQPFFGSDITLEDLAADFWNWPSPKLAGQGTVCHKNCYIIDWCAPKGRDADHEIMRAWISPETSLPLRIESYLDNGTLIKRTECRKLVKSGNRWSMAELATETPATGGRTSIDFSKGALDVEVPATDFTPAGIAKILQE